MPLFYSSNKSKDLSFVYENLEAQIKSWKSQSLSRIGRTTLIKSVAQFTPLYSVATVKFPKGLCDKMDSLVRKFQWNPHKNGNRLYTPVAWADLCKPLANGGLRFRSFERFNEAWWPSLLGRFCPIVTTSVSQFFEPNTVWVTIGYMPHQPNQLPFLGKALKGFESYYLQVPTSWWDQGRIPQFGRNHGYWMHLHSNQDHDLQMIHINASRLPS